MADEDSIKLKVEEDSSQVDRAKKKVELYRLELRDLNDAFDRGAVGGEFFRAEQARLEQQITRTTKAVEQGGKAAGGAFKGDMGYAVMAFSNAIDDVQYGIRGIVNNVPQLVTGLGMGAGMAGAAQIAMVAINQLVQRMGSLDEMFGRTNIDKFIEKLQKIADVGDKATAAWRREATGLGESGPLAGLKPAAETAAGAGIRGALAESGQAQAIGREAVERATANKFANDPFLKEDQRRRDEIRARVAKDAAWYRDQGSSRGLSGATLDRYVNANTNRREDEIKAIDDAIGKRRETLKEQARTETNQVIDAALAGDPNAAAALSDELRKQGRGDLAGTVQGMASDQAIAAGSAAEMADFGSMWDANEKAIKEAEKAQDKADADREKAIKDELELGKKSQEYEDKSAKDQKKNAEDQRSYQLQMIEANLGIGAARMGLMKNVFANPERIAAGDFARKAESAGAKEPLEVARQQLGVLKAIENYTKLAANPPKLGK